MKTILNAVAGAIAVSFLFVATTQSATINLKWNTGEPVADIGVPAATSVTGIVFEGATGSVGGVRRSPWDTITTNDLDGNGTYTSVSGDASATYDLGGEYDRLSFMWGSVDRYNMIEFWNGDNYLGELYTKVTFSQVHSLTLTCRNRL